eukprot:6208361-Pleurochrysis_carterae.AAC.6
MSKRERSRRLLWKRSMQLVEVRITSATRLIGVAVQIHGGEEERVQCRHIERVDDWLEGRRKRREVGGSSGDLAVRSRQDGRLAPPTDAFLAQSAKSAFFLHVSPSRADGVASTALRAAAYARALAPFSAARLRASRPRPRAVVSSSAAHTASRRRSSASSAAGR